VSHRRTYARIRRGSANWQRKAEFAS